MTAFTNTFASTTIWESTIFLLLRAIYYVGSSTKWWEGNVSLISVMP